MMDDGSRAVFRLRECVDGVVALAAPMAYAAGTGVLGMVYEDVPDDLVGDHGALARLLLGWLDAVLADARMTAEGEGMVEPVVVRAMLDDGEAAAGGGVRIRFSLPAMVVEDGGRVALEALLKRLEDSEPLGATGFVASFQRSVKRNMDGRTGVSALRGLRVLLHDPHPLTATVLGHRLRDLGLDVQVLETADALLSPALSSQPDVALIVLGLGADESIAGEIGPWRRDVLSAAARPIMVLIDALDAPDLATSARGGGVLVLPKSAPHGLLRASLEGLASGSSGGGEHALPVYERTKAIELAAGNEELAQQLFEMLREELPQRREALAAAVIEMDREEIRHVAHKLRGGASYCGVAALEQAAGVLEAEANDVGEERIRALAGHVEEEIRRVLEWRPGD